MKTTIRILFGVLLALFAVPVFAADSASSDGALSALGNLSFDSFKSNGTFLAVVAMIGGRIYRTLKSPDGLKGMFRTLKAVGGVYGLWRAVIFGETVNPGPAAPAAASPSSNIVPSLGLILALGLSGVAAVGLVGCSTFSASNWNEARIAKVETVVRQSASISVAVVVAKSPETKAYALAAADAIRLVAKSDFSPVNLQAALAVALKGDESGAILQALNLVLGVYQTFYAMNTEQALAKNPAFQRVLVAIADGVSVGAGGAAPSGASEDLVASLKFEDLQLR